MPDKAEEIAVIRIMFIGLEFLQPEIEFIIIVLILLEGKKRSRTP